MQIFFGGGRVDSIKCLKIKCISLHFMQSVQILNIEGFKENTDSVWNP